MDKIVFLLLVVGAGAAAYARARREDTWSWPLFGKTILGLLVLGSAVGIMVVRLGRLMGPENALPATIGAVVVIAGGVAGITIWVRGKTRHNRK
jgi:uncharacterized membrane protein HdeD (DUF308 family)